MKRAIEKIKEHYETEKELANRLKNSTRKERSQLYSSLYDELFRKIPYHPQLIRKNIFKETNKKIIYQYAFLKRFLKKEFIFVEIGPGDCALSFAISMQVRKVIAIDVSKEITTNNQLPENFQLILSDGISIPISTESADVVYSNQLMEHLHPDDAIEQLTYILNVLKKGGKYICITPNRINGPHDISKYFDREASGLHLKEYTFSELKKLFKNIGFAAIQGYIGGNRIYIRIPIFLIISFEWLLNIFPRTIKRNIIFRPLLSIRIVGIK